MIDRKAIHVSLLLACVVSSTGLIRVSSVL